MRFVDTLVIKHGYGIGRHVRKQVVALARRKTGGATGIAIVIADNKSAFVGEPVAPQFVPVKHRTTCTHDQ
jgi:hypothetical protein